MIAVGLFNAPMRKSALTRSNHKDTLVSEKTQLDFLVERLQLTVEYMARSEQNTQLLSDEQ